MSVQGLNHQIIESFGDNKRLAVYYDFNESNTFNTHTFAQTSSNNWSGTIANQSPAFDTDKYSGVLIHTTTFSSSSEVQSFLDNSVFASDSLDLTHSNLAVKTHDLNFNDLSVFVDFEFGGAVSDGVIFGSFEKTEETINSIDYTGAKGFNVGVTSRGHLFLQCYGKDQDQITVLDSELSKRNLIGISSFGDSITLSTFDYINEKITSKEIQTDSDYLANPDFFYIGGSKNYYNSSNEVSKTLINNHVNKLAVFSGAVSEDYLYYIGSGILGEYEQTPATSTSATRVTGYSETIVYQTGVTGYNYAVTGTLTIATGRESITAVSLSSAGQPQISREEGERYYKYYTLNAGGNQTFYKEELGHLHPDSGYIYHPTGDDAYATLGLQDISDNLSTFLLQQTTGQEQTTINLYGKTAITGTSTQISGVVQTPITESYIASVTEASSGVSLTGFSEDLKKNYIYYRGERI